MPVSVDFIEALVALKPVTHHKPRGIAAKAIDAIVGELLAQLSGETPNIDYTGSTRHHQVYPMILIGRLPEWPVSSTL